MMKRLLKNFTTGMRKRSSAQPERSWTLTDAVVSATVPPPEDGMWRVGRLPDPVAVPPTPEALVDDGVPLLETNRFDDSLGEFSTLYCGSTPEACFAETLAMFRKTDVVARIDAFMTEESDDGADFELESGTVPPDYIHRRALAHIPVSTTHQFVDVDDAATHAALNVAIPQVVRDVGLDGFDRGVMMTQDRRITRQVARYYYDLSLAHDHSNMRGLRYESRLSSEYECWALFVPPEPFDPSATTLTQLTWSDKQLRAAADRLSLSLPS